MFYNRNDHMDNSGVLMRKSDAEIETGNVELYNKYKKQGLDLRTILRTKYLTASFCKEILLSREYMEDPTNYEDMISIPEILYYQKHLTRDELWVDDSDDEEDK